MNNITGLKFYVNDDLNLVVDDHRGKTVKHKVISLNFNFTYNIYNYTLIQDMSSMEKIGEKHFKDVHITWLSGIFIVFIMFTKAVLLWACSFVGIKTSIIGWGHAGDFIENGAKMLMILVAHLIGYLTNAFVTVF